jgi:hypothetical protein
MGPRASGHLQRHARSHRRNRSLYFSDTTRNHDPKEYIASYRGLLLLLLQSHIQFQIITPRTLSAFTGDTLVLPDVRMLSSAESSAIHRFQERGRLVLTGHPDAALNDITGAIRFADSPERAYLQRASGNFETTRPTGREVSLIHTIEGTPQIKIIASREVVAHAATINGSRYIFLADFAGLQAGKRATPIPQSEIRIMTPGTWGTRMHLLPFLGTESLVTGSPSGANMQFRLPSLERGAVVWFETK